MDETKYKRILTIVLIILVIAVILVVGFVAFDIYRKHYIDSEAEKFIGEYENNIKNNGNNGDVIQSGINSSDDNSIDSANTVIPDLTPSNTTNNGNSSSSTKRYTYKGYNVIGTIEIPKTNIKYPILERDSKGALEVAVAYAYGAQPNQIGNMTIAGHNYRNGAFFGKNKQLSNGDIVYITDNSGFKVKYTIYNIYRGTPEESDFMTRDTNGKREISLITCTDDSQARLIIWAKED